MTVRGRKPKPTHLKLVTGNPGRRKLPTNEAKPKAALPKAPIELMADAKVEWRRISKHLFALGLLSDIDRGALAACCQSYGRWISAERLIAELAKRDPVFKGLMIKTKNGNMIQNPLVGTANKAMADYVRYCVEFGMTPSARSRIQVEKPEGKDEKDEFFDD